MAAESPLKRRLLFASRNEIVLEELNLQHRSENLKSRIKLTCN